MIVVVRQGDGDAQDEHGEQDDQPEPEVEIEVPSVLGFPRGSVGALDDGLGSKGHGSVDSCHMAGWRRGWRAAVWYTEASKDRGRAV